MDYEEIRREIQRLEGAGTTYANCEKLAVLYTVMNKANTPERVSFPAVSEYSYASEPESEFVQAAKSVEQEKLFSVLEEHFEAVKALYPKEYRAVLRKLKE